MLKRFIVVVLLSLGVSLGFGAAKELLKEGDKAPNFMLRDIDGVMVTLSRMCGDRALEAQRKIVVLDFFQVTCKPCIAELPAIKSFYNAWKDDGRVLFYMVGVGESIEKLKKFQEDYNVHELPMLSDPYFVCCKSFGVKSFPVTMIIDRQGIIKFVLKDKQPKINEILTENLKKLL